MIILPLSVGLELPLIDEGARAEGAVAAQGGELGAYAESGRKREGETGGEVREDVRGVRACARARSAVFAGALIRRRNSAAPGTQRKPRTRARELSQPPPQKPHNPELSNSALTVEHGPGVGVERRQIVADPLQLFAADPLVRNRLGVEAQGRGELVGGRLRTLAGCELRIRGQTVRIRADRSAE